MTKLNAALKVQYLCMQPARPTNITKIKIFRGTDSMIGVTPTIAAVRAYHWDGCLESDSLGKTCLKSKLERDLGNSKLFGTSQV